VKKDQRVQEAKEQKFTGEEKRSQDYLKGIVLLKRGQQVNIFITPGKGRKRGKLKQIGMQGPH